MINYKDYINLIRKCAWSKIKQNPNLDLQDLISEGNLAFAECLQTWDESRGHFSTHLYWQLRHHLGRINSGAIDDSNFLTTIDSAMELADLDSPLESCAFKSALDCLGTEAREVVNLILGSAGELCDFTMNSVKVTQGNIRNYLRGLKWPGRKIDKTMGEIKTMLRNL